MAAAVAGEILGPRPGMAIVSFWQGRVEITARIAAAVLGSLPALIAASVAVGSANSGEVDAAVSSLQGGSGGSAGVDASEIIELRDSTLGSAGWVIAITALAILVQIVEIVLRFCNIGLVNLKIKIFLIVDFILSVIFALGHVAGGIAVAVYASDWDTFSGTTVDRIRDSLAASAAFCFVALFMYAFLALWVIIYMVKDWNNKVVKYTIKDAITP